MRQRCVNPSCKNWKYYGGRGITICERWRNSFENFLEDMGEAPKGLQLDRINSNKNYCKSNCKWATRKQQQRNKRNNVYVTHNGKRQLLVEWSEKTGIPHKTLWSRLYVYGWSTQKTLTAPVGNYRKRSK